MGKTLALLKASMSEGMNFFRISGRNRSRFFKVGVPIIIGIFFMLAMASYADMMMEVVLNSGTEFVVLTLFATVTAIFILMEGVYKASGLLFNCRDDDTLLALPIKKSTVFLIRIFKFYLFEVIVNTLFLAPVMVVYGLRVGVPISFYLVSVLALFLLPILPVVISCLIGGVISYFSTKFKFKSLAQIVFTTTVLIAVIFLSFNIKEVMNSVAQNAKNINGVITRFYYPIGEYIDLVRGFDFWKLIVFVATNVGLLLLTVIVLGKVYYKINSRVKIVKSDVKKHDYKVKTVRPLMALVKKEIGKFISSPVFVVNAGFGLVLYIVSCVLIVFNIDGLLAQTAEMEAGGLSAEGIMAFLPAVIFGLVFVMSMMTSITSSMISLEGKSFNILKSLPVSSMKIILAKVLAAMMVMVPVFLVGDLIVFFKFNFDILQMSMILVASVMMPMIAELIGIIVNLKYPKMDAKDDVEVVKQSMSSMIAVFVGIGTSGLMIYAIYNAFMNGISASVVMVAGLGFGVVLLALLLIYLKKRGVKDFNAINV